MVNLTAVRYIYSIRRILLTFLFEYRYQGEKITLKCRFQCTVWAFNSLPATTLSALYVVNEYNGVINFQNPGPGQ